MRSMAVWKEGNKWWACWYKDFRIECMKGGFRNSVQAQKWARKRELI